MLEPESIYLTFALKKIQHVTEINVHNKKANRQIVKQKYCLSQHINLFQKDVQDMYNTLMSTVPLGAVT